MIKKILFISIASVAISAKAQVTITSSDIVTIGKLLVIGNNDDVNLIPGNAGANQTWNFSTINSVSDETTDVQNPAWSGFQADFPNSNIALKTDQYYRFITNTPSALYADGATIETPFIGGTSKIKFSTPEKMLQFPANINGTFTTTSSYTVEVPYETTIPYTLPILGQIDVTVDKFKISAHRTRIVTNDASGSLTTPLGTYATLRVKDYLIEVDSIYANISAPIALGYIALPAGAFPGINNPTIDTTTSFTWWANNIGYALLSMNFDNDTSSNVKYLKSMPSVSGLIETDGSSTNLFPNPSNGVVNISSQNEKLSQLQIFTTNGELVNVTNIADGKKTFDVSNLQAGVYFYNVLDTKNQSIKREKLIILKDE